MKDKNYALGKINFILMAICMMVIVIGFVLMSGSGSTYESYNPDIFSTLRIRIAPAICFIGFIGMIGAVMYKSKK